MKPGNAQPHPYSRKLFAFCLYTLASLGITGIYFSQNVSSRSAQIFLSEGTHHKLLLGSEETELFTELSNKNAIIQDIDYGSFRLLVVDENAIGGRAALAALSAEVRDEQNVIAFNGYA